MRRNTLRYSALRAMVGDSGILACCSGRSHWSR